MLLSVNNPDFYHIYTHLNIQKNVNELYQLHSFLFLFDSCAFGTWIMILNTNFSWSSGVDHMILLWTPGSCIGLIRQELVVCSMRQTPVDHAARRSDNDLQTIPPVTGEAAPHFCAWSWFPICQESSGSKSTRKMVDKHEKCFTKG